MSTIETAATFALYAVGSGFFLIGLGVFIQSVSRTDHNHKGE